MRTDEELREAFDALDRDSMTERLDNIAELAATVKASLAAGRVREFFEGLDELILAASHIDNEE